MRRIFLLLFAALLLGADPASAMNPLANVVVPNGQLVTFTAAPNKGTGATTTYNNNYYPNIEIQSGGIGVFNDGENVQNIIVRTGGFLRFGVNGEVSTALTNAGGINCTIALEPGAVVQLGNPDGLLFAQGRYENNNSGNGSNYPLLVVATTW